MELIHILTPFLTVLIILFLLVLSATFSATEIALFSFRKTKLAMLVKQQNKTALLIQEILEQPERLLSTILIGNNTVNTIASILGSALAIYYFGDDGVWISMIVMTFVLITFGEITPKVLGRQYWERFSFFIVRPMRGFYYLLYPLNFFFSILTKIMFRPFGIRIKYRPPLITKEELRHIIDISQQGGHIKDEERTMLHNIFEFNDRLVQEVMLSKDKIIALDISTPQDKAIELITEKHFTRVPAYEGDLDHIVGILHSKDFFNVVCYQHIIVWQDLVRKPVFVNNKTRISELLKEFQKKHLHMAIVRDDSNKTVGVITLENVLEQIVGSIQDEHN